MKRNEENARGFIRALLKAVDYAQKKPAEDVAAQILGHFPDASLESMTTSIANYQRIDSWFTDLKMPEASFTRLQTIIESAGELTSPMEFSKVVDNHYVEEEFAKM